MIRNSPRETTGRCGQTGSFVPAVVFAWRLECFSKLSDLLQHCDRMPNRIVQKYVERPLLLFSGRKFDLRQWVLVRSVQPLKVFVFSECYLRLCNSMYDLGDLRDRERHISNWQVNKHGKNVVEGAVVSLQVARSTAQLRQDFRDELEALTGQQAWRMAAAGFSPPKFPSSAAVTIQLGSATRIFRVN
eukprot:Skav226843  [mRNA]  locus=scaffold1741:244972:248696:- [translate_table: standard]